MFQEETHILEWPIKITLGRFLYTDSITIRYKLFYWSRHFCPMKSIIRAETMLPFLLKISLQS
jgi:hypothetical protein